MTRPGQSFLFGGRRILFAANETIAAALERAGVLALGQGQGQANCAARYFCGIGACQGCLVSVDGRRTEACLTPAVADQRVDPIVVPQ